MGELTPHARHNRDYWTSQAADYVGPAERHWASDEPTWGIWEIPEAEVGVVPDVDGLDVIELGCGTASVSSWLARGGFRPVAVDFSRKQLDVASRLQEELGLVFPLIHSNAEDVPYESASFDLAVSEYGASLWCEPHRWLEETDRLLRPGGRLIFVTNSPLLMACTPGSGERAGEHLVRDFFTSPVREYPDGVVEFHLTHGNWIELLGAFGLVVERLVELRPPHGTKPRFDFVSIDWARRWPSEEIWVARKRG